MDSPSPFEHRSTAPLDVELDRRDAASEATGVVELTARMRPAGGRRSSRHTHTRLVAALARIHESSVAANAAATDARTAVACGTER